MCKQSMDKQRCIHSNPKQIRVAITNAHDRGHCINRQIEWRERIEEKTKRYRLQRNIFMALTEWTIKEKVAR